ncbi:MAG: ribosomal protein L7/L12 [Oscillospiraceae bacterium]|nr:ribosomal protein L7/L12 [Oscillospiraceae bacterium]
MFCHKCGTQIADGAGFCHRCGTKVVYEETVPQAMDTSVSVPESAAPSSSTAVIAVKPEVQPASLIEGERRVANQDEQTGMPIVGTEAAPETFDVTLCAFANEHKIRVIREVRTWTGLSLQDAKELVERVPAVLKRAVTREDAELAKRIFTKAGATVSFTNQRGEPEEIDLQPADTLESAGSSTDSQGWLSDTQSVQQSPTPQETTVQNGPSKFKSWWDCCSKAKKILVALVGLLVGAVVLSLLVSFLREFGYLLFGIAVIGGFIVTLTTGSEKEKIETRKTIVQMVIGIVAIVIVALVVALQPDLVSNIFQPGAAVRSSYLSQYSESVTVGDAFDDFFANEKWSTYIDKGYTYVVFTGSFEYDGEPADARITFKITGENFRPDTLEINGVEQNEFMLGLLLLRVYADD